MLTTGHVDKPTRILRIRQSTVAVSISLLYSLSVMEGADEHARSGKLLLLRSGSIALEKLASRRPLTVAY